MPNDLRVLERLVIHGTQSINRRIRVRGRLKISQETIHIVAPFEPANPFVQLRAESPRRGTRRLGLKLRLSQKTQPPTATVPSTLGQVKPPFRLTFWTRWPKRPRMWKFRA